MIDFDQEWIARQQVLRQLNGFVLHCGYCNRPMREACRCGATPAKDMPVEADEKAADAPKVETWRDRPPLF